MYILESRSVLANYFTYDALNPFRHYLLISYMLLPDVGIWCNRALCVESGELELLLWCCKISIDCTSAMAHGA